MIKRPKLNLIWCFSKKSALLLTFT